MIEKFGGGLYRDLLFYYNVDLSKTITGDGPPPSLVLELVRHLPHGSVCESIENNTPHSVGWGILERISVEQADWAQATALSAGNWEKGKAPKFKGQERPWVPKVARVASEGMKIGDLHALFQAKLNNK